MSTENHPDPDQKKILQLYVVFGLCLVFSVIPHIWAAGLSVVTLLYVMFAAYYLRGQRPEDSLLANHMTFIIRTIWIGGLFAGVTLALGSVYLLDNINNAPLEPCIQKFLGMNPEKIALMNMQELNGIFQVCMDNFVSVNFSVLFASLIITGGPILLYFIVRYARGLSRARKGYRVAHPKAWF